MELTAYCYSLGETAYGAYCKQAGGKSLATGDTLPAYSALPQAIKDAWAASAFAVSNRLDHQAWAMEKIDRLFPKKETN